MFVRDQLTRAPPDPKAQAQYAHWESSGVSQVTDVLPSLQPRHLSSCEDSESADRCIILNCCQQAKALIERTLKMNGYDQA
jgi:hypothetical protein